ncbi:zinc-dependent peptidase [Shewanella litorisediminis]|uniref:Zinc-dependent peptidase n=1 Tax=Shewanella litorisediminis TaxID=1173586 RepID=A0ABX7G044_9GAMM|nr:M90 family metallopeptidase [Shewanella litorisediminis]MCL2918302.1 zinc-dependent peptidase [Shewanella litorisediminis]QRH00649.1 zinc-dependent peptidase [Shewanella litorisediminis]
MAALIIVSLLGMLGIYWIASGPSRRHRRHKALASGVFPASWRAILKKRVAHYPLLPDHLQQELRRKILIFLGEKQFIGCNGFQITDEVRLTIAAQACLLLLNRDTDFYPGLRQILVYPNAFYVNRNEQDAAGVVWERHALLSGESWSQGQVLLSWHDIIEDCEHPFDGFNVIIHEFAHQLDQEDGRADGAPPLPSSERYQSWSTIMQQEYDQLCHAADAGQPSLFDYYGATAPAEFFAVVSETFFTRPDPFAAQHRQLYEEFARFYRLDPAQWR